MLIREVFVLYIYVICILSSFKTCAFLLTVGYFDYYNAVPTQGGKLLVLDMFFPALFPLLATLQS